jgi:hypothetical protein
MTPNKLLAPASGENTPNPTARDGAAEAPPRFQGKHFSDIGFLPKTVTNLLTLIVSNRLLSPPHLDNHSHSTAKSFSFVAPFIRTARGELWHGA